MNYSFKCNKDSCCDHITGVVKVYVYGCVNLLGPKCAVCLCVCICVLACEFSSLEVKYDRFRNRDEGTWQTSR